MVDLSDYQDSPILHTIKGIFSSKYKARNSVLSSKQVIGFAKCKVLQYVAEHPITGLYVKNWLPIYVDTILEYSPSIEGKALGLFADAVHSRLAVDDNKKNEKGESEFND